MSSFRFRTGLHRAGTRKTQILRHAHKHGDGNRQQHHPKRIRGRHRSVATTTHRNIHAASNASSLRVTAIMPKATPNPSAHAIIARIVAAKNSRRVTPKASKVMQTKKPSLEA
jgi:hypothetical protein